MQIRGIFKFIYNSTKRMCYEKSVLTFNQLDFMQHTAYVNTQDFATRAFLNFIFPFYRQDSYNFKIACVIVCYIVYDIMVIIIRLN